jgi:adenine phosphoribosyltransferase
LAAAFDDEFDAVLGVEARGFVIGTAVAMSRDCPLLLARKPGKLPGRLHAADYDLEYGTATLTMQQGELSAGQRVLIVDDVLATGGTLAAAAELIGLAGAAVAGFAVVLELTALGGADRLAPGRLASLIKVA